MSKASNTKKSKGNKPTVVKQPKILADNAKIRKKPEYKSFRLHKKVKRSDLQLPPWTSITKNAFRLIKSNAKPIGWFFVIYGLLYLVFVRGVVSPINIDEVREQITDAGGGTSSIITNVSVLSLLIGSAVNSGGDIATLYQLLFLVASALALIWLFRQQQAGHKVSIKDAFYRGLFPLVPFILVVGVISLQTVPAIIGNFLFTSVIETGIAVSVSEQAIWLLLFLTTVLLSLYMVSSSIIALFIVTLPEMTPVLALKNAKELVAFRRASVLRKVVILILIVLAGYALVVLPSIFISAALAQAVFFFMTIFIVPFVVAYLFVLYRELL